MGVSYDNGTPSGEGRGEPMLTVKVGLVMVWCDGGGGVVCVWVGGLTVVKMTIMVTRGGDTSPSFQ